MITRCATCGYPTLPVSKMRETIQRILDAAKNPNQSHDSRLGTAIGLLEIADIQLAWSAYCACDEKRAA